MEILRDLAVANIGRDAVWVEDMGEPKEPCIRRGPDAPWEGQISWRKVAHCGELCKMADPIDLSFWLWARLGIRKHEFNGIRDVAPMCADGTAHCHHMANTIQPSVCRGDAAICQNYFDHLF